MSREIAQSIVCRVFEGLREVDEFFYEALAIVGMTHQQFFCLRNEVKKCERRKPAFVLCTPTGSGKNR